MGRGKDGRWGFRYWDMMRDEEKCHLRWDLSLGVLNVSEPLTGTRAGCELQLQSLVDVHRCCTKRNVNRMLRYWMEHGGCKRRIHPRGRSAFEMSYICRFDHAILEPAESPRRSELMCYL